MSILTWIRLLQLLADCAKNVSSSPWLFVYHPLHVATSFVALSNCSHALLILSRQALARFSNKQHIHEPSNCDSESSSSPSLYQPSAVLTSHYYTLLACLQLGLSTRLLTTIGDGKCVICDSYVRPCTLVRICDECNYGSYEGRCVICGGNGISDAYYCRECTQQVCLRTS
jgi:PHD finger-like domain-containing protein 5A